jgi:RNA polymerase sigma factor (sigma-70 family)
MAIAFEDRVLTEISAVAAKQARLLLSDEELLRQFVDSRNEWAFEILVRRHGPMILGLCQRIIGKMTDAEDAFQATFIVLARKSSTLKQPHLLGNWLYGVAYRIARKAKTLLLRRQQREQLLMETSQSTSESSRIDAELLSLLDEAIQRLPEKYRVPVLLCELQSLSRKEAAERLKIPEGTLSSRLANARKRLQNYFARHGVVLPSTIGVSLPLVPHSLLATTLEVSLRIGTSRVVEGSQLVSRQPSIDG